MGDTGEIFSMKGQVCANNTSYCHKVFWDIVHYRLISSTHWSAHGSWLYKQNWIHTAIFSVCLVICAAGLLMARYLLMRTISNFAGPSSGQEAFDVFTENENPKAPSGRWILYLSTVWKRKKTLLFKHAKSFSLRSKKQVSDLVKFSGNAALGLMWKILACINDRHIRVLLFNNEGSCTQSHVPERNQLLVRKDSFFPCCDSTEVRMWDGEKSV